MDDRIGIRIADPEEDYVPQWVVTLAVMSIVLTLATLYFLFMEFFEIPVPAFWNL